MTDEGREAAVTGIIVIFLFIYFEDSAGFNYYYFTLRPLVLPGSDASDNGIGGTQTLHFEMRTRLSRQSGIYLDMEGTYVSTKVLGLLVKFRDTFCRYRVP